jgi:hypothetical protein
MALPIDELVKKATTTTATVQNLIPQIWAAQIEKNLRKRAVMEQSVIVNEDLNIPNAGDTVYIPLLPDLAAATALTEGTDMTPIALNSSTVVPLVPAEYGVTVEATRKMLDRIKYDAVAEIMDRLAYSMSLAIEGALFALYNSTVAGSGNGQSPLSFYPNGHASGTIVVGDTFSDVCILDGVSLLEQHNNIPFEDGYYRLHITPQQYATLLQDANTRQDLRFAAPARLLSGEKGALHGCRVIVTNYIVTATENTQPVAKALLVAPRWAAIAYKRHPEAVVDPTLYDMGRRRRFGITADFVVGLVHFERVVVITTVNL